MAAQKYRHICEVCGRTEILTPDEAFEAGWDYPPRMGAFGVISARVCPYCPITETLWWQLAANHVDPNKLPAHHLKTLLRILCEPYSIIPEDEENDP